LQPRHSRFVNHCGAQTFRPGLQTPASFELKRKKGGNCDYVNICIAGSLVISETFSFGNKTA
jgi:hypothetical protein